ncbi:hypothetical protein IRT45_34440 [Nocardia sp. BSTN01]|uniref:hypothetical protein n=1 Tax=Nocardia sp. BSTN01 TaxID=2783665 RepID=UPI00188F55A9|nr:hypothetical protein [Nocardia sp. BSTN01]MBF5002218.1 hypothetical protein [Nocardia sp. BSTN01]
MATQRKSGAQSASTSRRQARPATPAAPAAPERIGILDELGVDGGDPQPIALLGVECDVRRRFTGDEAATFLHYLIGDKFEEALTLLTTDGPALWAKIRELDPAHAAVAMNRITKIAGIYDAEGEPFAPRRLPSFSSPAAGAQPSHESSATTD